MSASSAPALDAITIQLVAALGAYERDTIRMLDDWPNLETYREVSAGIEQIRQFSAVLPEARVQWVDLLVAHSELVHFLWGIKYGGEIARRLDGEAVRAHHLDCIAALRARCLRFLARSQQRV